MRRVLIAMLVTVGLLGGSAAASFAAKPGRATFAAPDVTHDTVPNAAGTGCTATFSWTHPTPEKVAAYYVVISNRLGVSPPTPKGKDAVPGTLVPGTSYSVDVLWPENQAHLWVVAKSTTGKWSAWALHGFIDTTPFDC